MQTQLMQPGKSAVPYFERVATDPGELERIPIQSVPFSIGRIETADLQVDSGNVSREHAVVVKEGKSYRLRDLGSTNGTLVNGQPIDEVELHHGDLVVIADREYSFVTANAGGSQRMATQVMSGAEKASDPFEHIFAVRRLQESLLHRGFRPQLNAIVHLEDGRTWGYACAAWDADAAGASNWLMSPFASSTWHACHLHRTLAAEAYQEIRQREMFVVGVSSEEAEGNEALPSQLAQLRSQVGEEALVVSLPAVVFEVERHPLLAALQQAGGLTALNGFVGSHSQIKRLTEVIPDFLFLSPTMSRDLHGGRQHRQLASIIDACDSIGCRPVVCDLTASADEDAFRELGFQLAMSSRGGRSQGASARLVSMAGH